MSVAEGEKLRCHVEDSSWQLVKVDNGLSQDFFLLSDRATIRAWSSRLRGRYEVKQLCMRVVRLESCENNLVSEERNLAFDLTTH